MEKRRKQLRINSTIAPRDLERIKAKARRLREDGYEVEIVVTARGRARLSARLASEIREI